MALSLPDLPAELLLEIVGSLTPSERRKTMEQLRATHPQIDEKIVYHYATEYHKSVTLHLDRTTLTRFESVVSGYLGVHIKSLFVDLSGLLGANLHTSDSDSGSGSGSDTADSKAEALKTVYDPWEIKISRKTRRTYLDKYFFGFIADGSCAALLDRALPKLQNLSSLTIRRISEPTDFKMQHDEIKSWRIVVRVMLSAVFNHCRSLQLVNIERNDTWTKMTIPVLDIAGFSSEGLRLIKDLAFDVHVGYRRGKWYLDILAPG